MARKRRQTFKTYKRAYEPWGDGNALLGQAVADATADHADVDMTWNKGKGERVRRLTADDLAAALSVVGVAIRTPRGKRNISGDVSYQGLARAFKAMGKIGCHRNKAAAIWRVLLDLNLIERDKGHSKGTHGTCWRWGKAYRQAMKTNEAIWMRELRESFGE